MTLGLLSVCVSGPSSPRVFGPSHQIFILSPCYHFTINTSIHHHHHHYYQHQHHITINNNTISRNHANINTWIDECLRFRWFQLSKRWTSVWTHTLCLGTSHNKKPKIVTDENRNQGESKYLTPQRPRVDLKLQSTGDGGEEEQQPRVQT